ncbi:MAG TPA: sugar transferase [Gaiellaceae bacterium]|nr:sugar transferase [Gaiellaceae bacterium]
MAADLLERTAEEVADARPAPRRSFWRGDPLRRRMLAVADLLAGSGFVAVFAVVQQLPLRAAVEMEAALPLWLLVAKLAGLYDRDHRTLRHLTADELPTLLLWVPACGGLTALMVLGDDGSVVSMAMLYALLAGVAAVVSLRVAARGAWRRLTPPARVAIVGEGPAADSVARKLELFRDIHADVVAELTLEEAAAALSGDGANGLGVAADRIVVASALPTDPLMSELLSFCRSNGVKLSLVPPGYGRIGSGVRVTHLADLSTLEYNTWDVSRSTLLIKRLLDVAGAALGLIALMPLLAAVALGVYAGDRGPVFFRQRRAGVGGRPFTILKFRTMVVDAEERLGELVQLDLLEQPVFKLRDDPRVTRFGRLLRRFSLDELPQLVNVLRGEMSLVGPRPEQVDLVERYLPEHCFRLSAKPGLTGPMQVYGRGDLSFDERLAVEQDYVENLSLSRDLRILALTLGSVVRRSGAF